MKLRLRGRDFEIHASDTLAQSDELTVSREFVKLSGVIQERAGRRKITYDYDVFLDGQKSLYFKAKSSRIIRPPGSMLDGLADFFCSSKTLSRVVRPTLADLQKDYCKALAENKPWKARWVCVRGYVSFWKALGLHTIAKNLVQLWKIYSSH